MDPILASLPFLTRGQMNWETGTTLGLLVTVTTEQTDRIFVRGATRSGLFTFLVEPPGSGSADTFTFPLTDLPIWVSVVDADNSYNIGTCFVGVALTVNGDVLHQLVSGQLGFVRPISWPESKNDVSYQGYGQLQEHGAGGFGAGAEATISLDSAFLHKIKNITFQLITSATAATRTVTIKITCGGAQVYRFISPVTQIASLTRVYTAHPVTGVPGTSAGTNIQIPIGEDMRLQGNVIVATETTNIQVDDQYSALNVGHETWFTN